LELLLQQQQQQQQQGEQSSTVDDPNHNKNTNNNSDTNHNNNHSNNNNSNYQYKVIVVDNLDNSSEESLRRVRQLVAVVEQQQQQPLDASSSSNNNNDNSSNNNNNNNNNNERLVFRKCDIRDRDGMAAIFQEFPDITSCIHFAGLKAVGASVSNPLSYYDCNVGGTITLLQLLHEYKVRNVVFSSSATVYGEPQHLPITEEATLQATNPYGRTKLFIEEILRDCYAAQPTLWNTLILRYFNPTPDGTGVRDYIHVVDLAKGHVAALEALYTTPNLGCRAVNLGTGQGISVLQLVEGMEKATGTTIPYVIAPRRPGDVATVYADPTTAQQLLHWKAILDVDDMCTDTWRWQSTNPYGYQISSSDDVVVEEEKDEQVVATTTIDQEMATILEVTETSTSSSQ
jgi:UDP-glucose 4-epimerase